MKLESITVENYRQFEKVESYLLRNPKDNILCITYTNRAAEELGRDLEQSRVYFGTIHSFINDFIGSFFSHKEIIDLYWGNYLNIACQ